MKYNLEQKISESFSPSDFIPSFKEGKSESFYFDKNKWIKCDSDKIDLLWQNWVSSLNAEKITDGDGFIVFGFNTKKLPITICYKFSEGIDVLKEKLNVGKEYFFSDMLQEEKGFNVEWKRGFLEKIERHPNSANCFVCCGQYFLYAREINL